MKKNCTMSVEEMIKSRPNVYKAWLEVKEQLDAGKNVILHAPVKSGKRVLAQFFAATSMRSCKGKSEQGSPHFFVTSLNKKDIQTQKEEMRAYGIQTFTLRTNDDVNELCMSVDNETKLGKTVYVHFDESDYGTNTKQLFDRFFKARSSNPNIKMICYSATNFEAAHSESNEKFMRGGNFAEVTMEPGQGYRGCGWFLDEGLVSESEEFFTFGSQVSAGPQGIECLRSLLTKDLEPGRIGVVRICHHETFKMLKDRLDEVKRCVYGYVQKIDIRIVDQNHPYSWGEDGEWKAEVESGRSVLIFVHQTCTRSTELGFHEHLAFWHEHRNKENSTIATTAQSVLRIAHYHPTGHRIKVFTSKEHLEAYDGRNVISSIPLSSRVCKANNSIVYDIELFAESDLIMVDNCGKKTNDSKKAKKVRIQGHNVPKPYADAGSKDFSFTRYSGQGKRGGKRKLINPVLSGSPRSMKDPIICFDQMGPDINKLSGIKTVSGKDVITEIKSGRSVFYYARPTNKTKQPNTKKSSVFSKLRKIS